MYISLYVSINDQRAIRLKPAFVACQLGDFDSLAEMILNQEIFGSLTIPTSEERILCLNATESAIREQTFLHLAAFYGHLDIAQLFCSFPEINLEASDWHGMTPLLLAAQKNNIPVAQELLRRGADPEKTDKFGRSMLLFSKYPTVCSSILFLLLLCVVVCCLLFVVCCLLLLFL